MRLVFGFGPASARIMIIGERPGAEEIKLGRPFVGRSGQFLTKELEKIGIKRDEVYITTARQHRNKSIFAGMLHHKKMQAKGNQRSFIFSNAAPRFCD
ncbi:MAG: hypothetical protein HYT16_01275 [DPANN group archaeon]|nr:hypothetical protein [DPANN group archaeon]